VKANVVRLATVVAGVASVVVAFVDRLPTDIPAYAFGDASVLRAERGLALLAILFIAFVVLWRGVAEGELPIEISREGFKSQQGKWQGMRRLPSRSWRQAWNGNAA
jgi:hypothetical protein